MRFSENIFVEDASIDTKTVEDTINSGQSIYGLYLICITNENNLLEIIHSIHIHKPYFTRKKYTVVGLANGKEESIILVQNIISKYIQLYNDMDFKKLKKRMF